MTDQRLRELVRRGDTTDALEDVAVLLSQRLRAGHLEPDAVALAAYLGEPAARALLGAGAPRPAPQGVAAALRGLAALGWPETDAQALALTRAPVPPLPWRAAVRFAVELARLAVPILEPHDRDDRPVDEAIQAALAWLADPTPERRAAAVALLVPSRTTVGRQRAWQPSNLFLLTREPANLVRLPRGLDTLGRTCRNAAKELGAPAVRDALASLGGWALTPP